MNIIRLLPDSVANQIAGGQVIQSPNCVVKELLENSIDAGAEDIQVIIKDGGKTLIQIIDNGSGMSETDAKMCFERHATSKIYRSEDINNIRTFGFRGEALAAISAVSHVEMLTAQEGNQMGTLVFIEGSKLLKIEPAAAQKGTSISVKNLFFNIPGRRKSLERDFHKGFSSIREEFIRVALAYPEKKFSLHHNDSDSLILFPETLLERICHIFANQKQKEYQKQLISIREENSELEIKGYIGTPELVNQKRNKQYIFINKRYIKSPYLNNAIERAYEYVIPKDRHPIYFLFFSLDPHKIDININPQKDEVKFDDEKLIYSILHASIKFALNNNYGRDTINFEKDTNFQYYSSLIQNKNKHIQDRHIADKIEQWEKFYVESQKERLYPLHEVEKELLEYDASPTKIITSSQEKKNELKATLFQLENGLVCKQIKNGIMFVHPQYAHERILYEKYIENIQEGNSVSQKMLFPEKISLSDKDFEVFLEIKEYFEKIGFSFDVKMKKQDNIIFINAHPLDMTHTHEATLLKDFIEEIKYEDATELERKKVMVAKSLAKKTSLTIHKKITKEEAEYLIERLFLCENSAYSPYGKPTYKIIDESTLEEYF
ncbi:MAG: DNA mismatch repair endonuclease MutL [Chitinophagaceae bacterium]|nr:DNA mismatch repair endonuclease MutL [Chitinophagaceae bacterium]